MGRTELEPQIEAFHNRCAVAQQQQGGKENDRERERERPSRTFECAECAECAECTGGGSAFVWAHVVHATNL
jgi:hypothetical protein